MKKAKRDGLTNWPTDRQTDGQSSIQFELNPQYLRYSSNKILTAKLSKAGSPKVCDKCIPEYFQLFHLLFCRRCWALGWSRLNLLVMILKYYDHDCDYVISASWPIWVWRKICDGIAPFWWNSTLSFSLPISPFSSDMMLWYWSGKY